MSSIELDRAAVVKVICETAREVAGHDPNVPELMDERTWLFGPTGFLDSLALVSVVLDVEQKVNDLYGLSISLADDRSVSQRRSPFRSVGSLADYVLMVAGERQGE